MKHYILAAAAVLATAAPANAATVLAEDFSAGFGAFTPSDGVAVTAARPNYQTCCGATGTDANLDNPFAAFGGGNGVPQGALTAQFNTVAGALYTLSFRAGAFGAGDDTLQVTFGGLIETLLLSANNNVDTTFATYSYSFTGTGGASTLTFTAPGAGINIDPVLDDVVVSDDVTAAVPEPATWGMLLLGMGMVGAGMRARRRSASVTYA